MSKVWFFGDSFCANNDNWVAQVAKNLNCEIASLGIAGTSIEYLAESLLENRNLISEEDYVIVCFTDYPRHYIKGINFRISHLFEGDENWTTYDEEKSHFVSIDEEKKEAYKVFVEHLYTDDLYRKNSFIIINHIINDILTSLPTKKVIYFFSMADDIKTFEFYRQNQPVICIPLFNIFREFVENNEDYFNLSIEDQYIRKAAYLRSNNHFIEEPEYYKLFWQTINPVLEIIGAQTKIN